MSKKATSKAQFEPKTLRKTRRFNQAGPQGRQAKVGPPALMPDQNLMSQLLPGEKLKALARSRNAGDVRERKLTCTAFFWMAVLAFGPGGPITLHKVLTYALVACLMAGLEAQRRSLSKEAWSENFRERPWQFFEAVLQYLLATYTVLWSSLAGQPNLVVVQQLHVLLVDATVMRVAHRLIEVFPASANGKCQTWAAVKLHTAFRLFRGVPEVLEKYPVALIIDLYRLRWQIEILFRNLKHVLQIANFISTTENGIRIQIYAALIHYVLTHLIILKAAQEMGRPVEDFSVPYCLEAIQQVLQQAGQLVLTGHTPDWVQLEEWMVQAVMTVGLRPNRKRKPLTTEVKARLRHLAPLPTGGP
jgi:hypothetical protein